jgi:alkylated DNA nucleotide flippase Atl1
MTQLQMLVVEAVNRIPRGKVLAYGDVGSQIGTSGRQVGQLIKHIDPETFPWWRVCNKKGEFPIVKRNPMFENEQRQRLEEEGVPFLESGRVDMARARLES